MTDEQIKAINEFFDEIQDLEVDPREHSWFDILAMIEDIKDQMIEGE